MKNSPLLLTRPFMSGQPRRALRGSVASVISAPITNPTLTVDGTELNLYTMHRSRQERDQLYNTHPATRPISPINSPSTADSSTLYSESDKTYSHHRSTTSVSETSVSSGRRSPSVSDFGGYHSQRKGSNQQTARPTSRATTRSDRMSTNTRSIVPIHPPNITTRPTLAMPPRRSVWCTCGRVLLSQTK
jgi:cytokinesis protein